MKGKPDSDHFGLVLLAAVVSVGIWMIPVARIALLPLTLLETLIHEMCHAVVAVLTGGVPQGISMDWMGNGVTPVLGGNAILVSMAGYLGTVILGGLVLHFSRTESNARRSILLLGLLCALSLIWTTLHGTVGLVTALMWSALLITANRQLNPVAVRFAAAFLGVHLSLSALHSLFYLTKITSLTNVHSDAANMQALTGVPALAWAILWTLFGLTIVLYISYRQFRNPSARKSEG